MEDYMFDCDDVEMNEGTVGEIDDDVGTQVEYAFDVVSFIQGVQESSFLYDKKHEDFKDGVFKAAVWESIGQSVVPPMSGKLVTWKRLCSRTSSGCFYVHISHVPFLFILFRSGCRKTLSEASSEVWKGTGQIPCCGT